MGETSIKSMRGSGMEDIIFSGTSNKPPKNISEVTITLDNSKKKAKVDILSWMKFPLSEELSVRKDQSIL